MSKKILVAASNNNGKIKEIKEIFNDYDILSINEIEKELGKKIIVTEYNDALINVSKISKNNNINFNMYDTTMKSEREVSFEIIDTILSDMRRIYIEELDNVFTF